MASRSLEVPDGSQMRLRCLLDASQTSLRCLRNLNKLSQIAPKFFSKNFVWVLCWGHFHENHLASLTIIGFTKQKMDTLTHAPVRMMV